MKFSKRNNCFYFVLFLAFCYALSYCYSFMIKGGVYGSDVLHISNMIKNPETFTSPTTVEGFPIALLEAIAAGTAVITTPVGGIPEVIKDGENGFLIKPGDIEALNEKILILARNNKSREEMGRNRELAKEKYHWDVTAEKVKMVYGEVVGEGEK